MRIKKILFIAMCLMAAAKMVHAKAPVKFDSLVDDGFISDAEMNRLQEQERQFKVQLAIQQEYQLRMQYQMQNRMEELAQQQRNAERMPAYQPIVVPNEPMNIPEPHHEQYCNTQCNQGSFGQATCWTTCQ